MRAGASPDRFGPLLGGLACLLAIGGAVMAVQGWRLYLYRARAAALRPALQAWHEAVAADRARLVDARRSGQAALDSLARDVGTVHGGILRLDAEAEGLVEDRDLDLPDFDFADDPAVGGPEEPAAETDARPEDIETDLASLAGKVHDRARQLDALTGLLEWRSLRAAILPAGRPVAGGYVSSGFGARVDPFTGKRTPHYGMDFAAKRGTAVVAVAAGVVTWAGPRGGYGNLVEIDHGHGRVTRYGHNSKILVHMGQVVSRGQLIARLGATGRATGPNLHFEVRENGRPVDPTPFLKRAQAP